MNFRVSCKACILQNFQPIEFYRIPTNIDIKGKTMDREIRRK